MHTSANGSLFSKIKVFISTISPKTVAVMNCLLFPLTVAFLYISAKFYRAACFDIIMAKDDFAPIFEHLMVTLMIVICGSALLDLTIRETENDK